MDKYDFHYHSIWYSGCGGYLIDEGIVNSPPPKSNLIEAGKLSSCEWFIEASDENAIILMSRPSNVNLTSSYSVKVYLNIFLVKIGVINITKP
jgi:hypothetical protein